MASNDFIVDLVEKIAEENIEYLLITVQKGKTNHKSDAYFNITTVDGADMILTTADEVFRTIEEDKCPDHLEIDLSDDDPEEDEEK